ncbi:hypothetical protein N431DRAFT_44701, partial [Stipitochalara longipes BDJ]
YNTSNNHQQHCSILQYNSSITQLLNLIYPTFSIFSKTPPQQCSSHQPSSLSSPSSPLPSQQQQPPQSKLAIHPSQPKGPTSSVHAKPASLPTATPTSAPLISPGPTTQRITTRLPVIPLLSAPILATTAHGWLAMSSPTALKCLFLRL